MIYSGQATTDTKARTIEAKEREEERKRGEKEIGAFLFRTLKDVTEFLTLELAGVSSYKLKGVVRCIISLLFPILSLACRSSRR